jgi:hypothetical protein
LVFDVVGDAEGFVRQDDRDGAGDFVFADEGSVGREDYDVQVGDRRVGDAEEAVAEAALELDREGVALVFDRVEATFDRRRVLDGTGRCAACGDDRGVVGLVRAGERDLLPAVGLGRFRAWK